MRRIRAMLLVGLFLMLHSAGDGVGQPRYTLTNLGTFQPRAMAGPWVVGVDQPIIPGGVPIRLNIETGERVVLPHAGYGAQTTAVLNTGEAIGNIWQPFPNGDCCGDTWGAFWDTSGRFHYLPGSAARVSTFAWGINASQAIAGQVYVPSIPGDRASRWLPGQLAQVFGTLGGNTSQGIGIDAQNRVWGNARTAGSEDYPITARTHAVIFHNDGMIQDLGTLDGQYSLINGVSPEGIGLGTSGAWAFTATAEGGITALPILGAFHYCSGRSIASGAASVGICTQSGGAPHLDIYHATLWPDASQAIDLNSLVNTGGWVLESAAGISDEGAIVGTMLRQGERRGYLLTPIPSTFVPPSLAVSVNKNALGPGDTLRLALTMDNPGPLLTVDHYVGIILPDGQSIVWLTNTAPLEGVVGSVADNPAAFTPMLRGVNWPAGMHVTQTDYLTYTFTGLELPGVYHLLVGWTKPASLQDGRIDDGDVVALVWTALSVTGGAAPRVAAQ